MGAAGLRDSACFLGSRAGDGDLMIWQARQNGGIFLGCNDPIALKH